MLDDASRPALPQSLDANPVKYDKSNTIILVPQPSEDPNDPLVQSLEHPIRHAEKRLTRCRTGPCGSGTLSCLSSRQFPSSHRHFLLFLLPIQSHWPSSSGGILHRWPFSQAITCVESAWRVSSSSPRLGSGGNGICTCSALSSSSSAVLGEVLPVPTMQVCYGRGWSKGLVSPHLKPSSMRALEIYTLST